MPTTSTSWASSTPEWIGVAPFLEEDLALSSIGQDELGHAALLYELVLGLDGIEPTDTAVDELAFGRPSPHYRSCHLVERATTDWAEALVRHWIYDTFEEMRWRLVTGSSLPDLATVAAKALREEAYHRPPRRRPARQFADLRHRAFAVAHGS